MKNHRNAKARRTQRRTGWVLFIWAVSMLAGWAQDFSQVVLTCTPATNQAAVNDDGEGESTASAYQVWVGSAASHNYSAHWPAWTNGFTVTAAMLQQGMNYIAVSQISTNADGTADVTGFSGEVQIQNVPQIIVTPLVTNMELLVSTDLGRSWSTTGTNLVQVPVNEVAQQFYRAQASFTVTIVKTNVLQIMQATQPAEQPDDQP